MSDTLPNPAGPLFILTPELMTAGKRASRASPRRRIMQPVQRSQEARVQRLLNFVQPETYVRPHCHPLPHATESMCLIEGSLDVLIFDETGIEIGRYALSRCNPIIDLEPGTWHGMIVREPDTVIFEVKQGPYDAATDKKFAPWAPAEGTSEAGSFLENLR